MRLGEKETRGTGEYGRGMEVTVREWCGGDRVRERRGNEVHLGRGFTK
jgi:hypothetical protein